MPTGGHFGVGDGIGLALAFAAGFKDASLAEGVPNPRIRPLKVEELSAVSFLRPLKSFERDENSSN